MVASESLDEAVQIPPDGRGVHHTDPEHVMPWQVPDPVQQFRKRPPGVPAIGTYVLCSQLDLRCAFPYKCQDLVMDFPFRATFQVAACGAGDAVGAGSRAPPGDLDYSDRPVRYGPYLPVAFMDGFGGDDNRTADSPDRLELDRRHAPGNIEVAPPELRQTPQHPPLRRSDHRAGIDDDRVGQVFRRHDRIPVLFQDLDKFCRVPEIVTAPVGLDKDPPVAKEIYRPFSGRIS